jgi:multisite-specific tRNA:(cytosine-C5)-methyltransferase
MLPGVYELDRERITLPLWRSINSINLMLPKEERKAMLLRLFNDESELVDHAKDRERAAAESRAVKEEAEAADVDVKMGNIESAAIKTNGSHEVKGAEPKVEEEEANGVNVEDAASTS